VPSAYDHSRSLGLIVSVALLLVSLPTVAVRSDDAHTNAGWSLEPTVNPLAPEGAFSAVSCSRRSACTAVGQHFSDRIGGEVTLAERWNGTAWSIQHTAYPARSQGSQLRGVACSADDFCMAIGSYAGFDREGEPLSERWDGKRSFPCPMPPSQASCPVCRVSPAKHVLRLDIPGIRSSSSLSLNDGMAPPGPPCLRPIRKARWRPSCWLWQCSSLASCIAVGYSIASNGGDVNPLAERWNGVVWSILPTPSPSGAQASILSGVSCTTSSACTAVGTGPSQTPLAERWNGNGVVHRADTHPIRFGRNCSIGRSVCNGQGLRRRGTH
jgi:hypothetical protein